MHNIINTGNNKKKHLSIASIMKPAVITFTIYLLALHVEGLPICNCPYYIEDFDKDFDISSITNHHIYEATPSCPRRIIVFTATNGNCGECVNPESDLGEALYDMKTIGQSSYHLAGLCFPNRYQQVCQPHCLGPGLSYMHPPFEYEGPFINPFCPLRFEITTNGRRCVNPGSHLEKSLIYHMTTGQDPDCKCPDQGIDSMHPSLIINYTISEETQFCPVMEIVVTTTDGKKPCVNLESNLGKFIYDIRRTGQRDSCTCPDQGIDYMNSSLIKDYQIHEASPSCPSREIIVTTTNGTEECVNPESDFGKHIYKLNNQRTAGLIIGVGVGVGVSVFVLIFIYGVCCRTKKEHSPTSECE